MKPYYAKPGWSQRYAPLIEAAKVIGLTAFYLGGMALMYVYILVLAPAGAR